MTDPNQNCPEEVLRRLKDASYERFRIELVVAIERLLSSFDMTWDDLANKMSLRRTGDELKKYIGQSSLSMEELNEIAHVFSAEPYLIFRPRFPFTLN